MVIQELRRASTRGSPTPPSTTSLVRTRASDKAAAPQPATPTTKRLDGFGGRLAPMPASDASADADMSLSLLSVTCECRQRVDGTSQAQPLMRVAQRTRVKGGVCGRGYSPTFSGATFTADSNHARDMEV